MLSFYALIGFDDSVNVAEEVREPSRAYPRALFGGLLGAGIVYLLVTFTAPSLFPVLGIVVSGVLLIYTATIDIAVFGLAGVLLLLGLFLYGVNYLAKRSLEQEPPTGCHEYDHLQRTELETALLLREGGGHERGRRRDRAGESAPN